MLSHRNTARDLLIRVGREAGPDGTKKDTGQRRFIIPIKFPTPGRTYYQKPYWYSVIESGWFDIACNVPKAKKALLENSMVLSYQIFYEENYFKNIQN